MYTAKANVIGSIITNNSVNVFIRDDITHALRHMKIDATTDKEVNLADFFRNLKNMEGIYEVAKLTPQYNTDVWLKVAEYIYNQVKDRNTEYSNVIFNEASFPAIADSLRHINGEHVKYTLADFIHIAQAFIEYPTNINMYLDIMVFAVITVHFRYLSDEFKTQVFMDGLRHEILRLLVGAYKSY